MTNIASLGNHLKTIRKSKNITLAELAGKTGLSVSYLSKIERGISNLTINNAHVICLALGIDLINILMSPDNTHDVTTASEREVLFENQYTRTEALCNQDLGSISFTCTTINENAPNQHDTPAFHDFDEVGVVISGILNVYLDRIPHMLYPGDCIYIKANTPRVLEKATEEPAVSYWIHLGKTACES